MLMPEWLLGMMYVIMFACLFGNFVFREYK